MKLKLPSVKAQTSFRRWLRILNQKTDPFKPEKTKLYTA